MLLGVIELWTVFAVASAFGVLTALDNPARTAFILEIAGRGLIRNAITLNSTFVNVGRAVGPVVATTLVASVGIGWRFVAMPSASPACSPRRRPWNVTSCGEDSRRPPAPTSCVTGWRTRARVAEVVAPLCMMALVGTVTYEFEVSLPLFAQGPLAGGATT